MFLKYGFFLFLMFVFGGIGDWTQVLEPAR
jgi:hypothetical protein